MAPDKWTARIKSSLPDGALRLRSLQGTEGISEQFHFHLTFSSTEEIDFAEVVGSPLTVVLTNPGAGQGERYFSGIVSRFAQGQWDDGRMRYEAELVPWSWILSRTSHCRTWPETSTHEIVKKVLSAAPEAQLTIDSKSWSRPYTVQYQESDLDFVSRLLEEEGHHYFFDHEETAHKLYTRGPGTPSAQSTQKLDWSRSKSGAEPFTFQKEQGFTSAYWEVKEFDWKDPGEPFTGKVDTRLADGHDSKVGHSRHPAQFVKSHGGSSDSAKKLAKVRMMESDSAAVRYTATSRLARIAPGHGVEVSNHFAFDGTYYVTRVTHSIELDRAENAGGVGAGLQYRNSFECVKDDVDYAPPRRTARPRIYGVHSAVVDSNEDPDGHGRVKVSFPWAPETSIWVRVSQGWAGAGWGMQFHPRPGHEVLVEFYEGDPDQPVIIGRVYNGANAGPYSENMKWGGVKTRSYEGGAEDANELRFDDTKGSEEILLHAQKNNTIEVEADEGKSVGGNRTESVGSNTTIEVGGDHNETIGGSMSVGVDGARTEAIGGGKSVSVGEGETYTVSEGQTIDVGEDRRLTVGASMTESISDDLTTSAGKAVSLTSGKATSITVGDAMTIKVDASSKTTIKEAYGLEAKEIAFKAKDKISFECGKAKVTLSSNGDVVIEGGKMNLKASKDVVMKGKKIAQN